ncbi:type II toxin-antitoxin system VapC family toxin [Pimelobacter simplex]|uniref:type II toxin-antitoxin system VapC family toxin n=1 Tax=Nocardioides simplex TaxID=2045 RepID=UPI001375AECF|nr:type II toxin-antitoxin system VapC family toxin [Pimelobacter simplex]
MTLLLDTHAFYRTVRSTTPVPDHVRTALDEAPRRFVSDVSAYEVALKVRLGRFPAATALRDRWTEALTTLPAIALPMATSHALLAGSLDWEHRDPFDRLLAAQAILEGLTLVTADAAFGAVPGLSVLRW